MRYKQISGIRFGRLTVLELSENHPTMGTKWTCKCDCGTIKDVWAKHLRSGATKSCGCLSVDVSIQQSITGGSAVIRKHGMAGTPEFHAWAAMKSRCLNKNSKNYKHYGARGIAVCQRWLDSFNNFLSDMGPRPSDKKSVDRIDNNKGYSPDNCRWADCLQQSRNRSCSVFLTHNGEKKSIEEWASITGIRRPTIWSRLSRGYSDSMALTKPLRVMKRRSP